MPWAALLSAAWPCENGEGAESELESADDCKITLVQDVAVAGGVLRALGTDACSQWVARVDGAPLELLAEQDAYEVYEVYDSVAIWQGVPDEPGLHEVYVRASRGAEKTIELNVLPVPPASAPSGTARIAGYFSQGYNGEFDHCGYDTPRLVRAEFDWHVPVGPESWSAELWDRNLEVFLGSVLLGPEKQKIERTILWPGEPWDDLCLDTKFLDHRGELAHVEPHNCRAVPDRWTLRGCHGCSSGRGVHPGWLGLLGVLGVLRRSRCGQDPRG